MVWSGGRVLRVGVPRKTIAWQIGDTINPDSSFQNPQP